MINTDNGLLAKKQLTVVDHCTYSHRVLGITNISFRWCFGNVILTVPCDYFGDLTVCQVMCGTYNYDWNHSQPCYLTRWVLFLCCT